MVTGTLIVDCRNCILPSLDLTNIVTTSSIITADSYVSYINPLLIISWDLTGTSPSKSSSGITSKRSANLYHQIVSSTVKRYNRLELNTLSYHKVKELINKERKLKFLLKGKSCLQLFTRKVFKFLVGSKCSHTTNCDICRNTMTSHFLSNGNATYAKNEPTIDLSTKLNSEFYSSKSNQHTVLEVTPSTAAPKIEVNETQDFSAKETYSQIHSSGGTKPKTYRNRSIGGTSSDDTIYQPFRARVKYKPRRSSKNDGPYSNVHSSDSDEHAIGTRQERILGTHKARNSRSKKKILSSSRSSSSSRSRSCSRLKLTKNNGVLSTRSRSHSDSRTEASIQKQPMISVMEQMIDKESNEVASDNFRHQSQNTDVMGVNKSFSTIENELFLRRVEEVLSDIVDQKKRRILEQTTHYSSTPYQTTSVHHSLEIDQRQKRKREGRWVLSKHYDINKHTKSSFCHIVTSHGDGKLRYRSRSTDLLETHRQCFTKLEPYKPRILRKDCKPKLIADKNYQPPRYRKDKTLADSAKLLNIKSQIPSESNKSETSRSLDQRSITGDDNIRVSASNTEAYDTCYESDHGGSDCAIDFKDEVYTRRHGSDQAEASVDSAYTGSRGPTPDDQSDLRIKTLKYKLQTREKNLQHSRKIVEETSQEYCLQKHSEKFNPEEPIIDKIKREIVCEIKEIGIYSNFAIDTLLQLYRRKYSHISRTELDIVSQAIREKFGLEDEIRSVNRRINKNYKNSPKKSRVKFIPVDSETSTDECCEKKEKPFLHLEEIRHLEEILERSNDTSDKIRWLSKEEVNEAKWASRILNECGIMKETSKVLDTASTWDDLTQALDISISSYIPRNCGHEKIESNEDPSLIMTSKEIILHAHQLESEINNLGKQKPDLVMEKNTLEAELTQCSLHVPSVFHDGKKIVHFEDEEPNNIVYREDRKTLNVSKSDETTLSIKEDISPEREDDIASNGNLGFSEGPHNCENRLMNISQHTVEIHEPQRKSEDKELSVDTTLDGTELLKDSVQLMNLETATSSEATNGGGEEEVDFFDTCYIAEESCSNEISEADKLESNRFVRSFKAKTAIEKIINGENENMNLPEDEYEQDPVPIITVNPELENDCKRDSDRNGSDDSNPQLNFSDSQKISASIAITEETPSVRVDPSYYGDTTIVNNIDYSDRYCNEQPISREPDEYEGCDYIIPASNGRQLSTTTDELTSFVEPIRKLENSSGLCERNVSKSYDTGSVGHSNIANSDNSCLDSQNSCIEQGLESNSINSGVVGGSFDLESNSMIVKCVGESVQGPNDVVNPTQPSLKGKIAALAAAYARRTDDTPEWLLVADDICKQFNISL